MVKGVNAIRDSQVSEWDTAISDMYMSIPRTHTHTHAGTHTHTRGRKCTEKYATCTLLWVGRCRPHLDTVQDPVEPQQISDPK